MRGHEIVQDKPPAYGGGDQGPMASELLLASLLSCQLSSLAKLSAKRGVDVDVEELAGECRFDEKGDISALHLAWRFRGGDDKQLGTLVRLSERICTVGRALKVPVHVRYERR